MQNATAGAVVVLTGLQVKEELLKNNEGFETFLSFPIHPVVSVL